MVCFTDPSTSGGPSSLSSSGQFSGAIVPTHREERRLAPPIITESHQGKALTSSYHSWSSLYNYHTCGDKYLESSTFTDNDLEIRLSIDNLNAVYSKLVDASSVWLYLGLALGISHTKLSDISNKNPGDNKKCLLDMLVCWLTSGSTSLTWGHLCECLREKTVNRHDVAVKIEQKHGGNCVTIVLCVC